MDVDYTLLRLAGLSAAKFLFSYIASSTKAADLRKVATVKSLHVFPIKSVQGLEVKSVLVTRLGGIQDEATGIVDRTWVIVDPQGGFVSALKAPKLFQARCSVQGKSLLVSFDGMEDLRVPLQPDQRQCQTIPARVWNRTIDALDCGDEAASWFQRLTEIKGVRLAHASPKHIVHMPKNDAKTKKFNMKFDIEKVAFQDLAPVNLLSVESLSDVSERVPRPVSNEVMRANILVAGCAPYAEDTWRTVHAGSSEMYFVKLGTRCKRSTIDVNTGDFAPDGEPNKTLNSYRYDKTYERPALSVDLGITREGVITVGDEVYAAV